MNEPATNITIVGTETELRVEPTYKLLKEHLQKTYPSVMKIMSAKNGELIRIENVRIIGYEVQQKETILDKIKKLQHKQKKAYYGLYDTRWNRWRKYSQNEIIKSITNREI